jgi:hypothetical protein
MSDQHIQSISLSKLAKYNHAPLDMRKYVLIANILREPKSEEHWFENCLQELDTEEEEEEEKQDTVSRLRIYNVFICASKS